MKRSLVILAVLALSLLFSQNVFAQTTPQTLTLSVQPVTLISASAGPTLTISSGSAGDMDLTSDQSTGLVYNITHNGEDKKVSAAITTGGNMPTDTKLKLDLSVPSGSGGTATEQELTTVSADIVGPIPKGAYASTGMTYTFEAKATAGILNSFQRTVTLTLTDN